MENREHLMFCALHLFSSRGYEAVGVQEIVESAGLTKPTLYHYFGSKHGLLDAMLKEYYTDFNHRVREAADYHGDLPLTLNHIAAAYFQFARERRTFTRMALALGFAPPSSEAYQAVLPYSREQYVLLEEMFAQAAENHGNMKGRQRAYAATLIGMLNTYVIMFLNGHIDLDDQLLYQAVHQFMHGIFS
ncbi:MAG: TetR/AcrR family transcriptional regulator [Chloroflexi bacterium]|jgi:AcrR family transcriptional regulator|nr:TetR/AcrR family transcriptional regulator [Anaerolineaceae bacterium]NMB89472.1 TetR/AcrR family transcriptional regulator [Chloroflexota bacterium]